MLFRSLSNTNTFISFITSVRVAPVSEWYKNCNLTVLSQVSRLSFIHPAIRIVRVTIARYLVKFNCFFFFISVFAFVSNWRGRQANSSLNWVIYNSINRGHSLVVSKLVLLLLLIYKYPHQLGLVVVGLHPHLGLLFLEELVLQYQR